MDYVMSLTSKRQATFPKDFVDLLGLVPGEKMVFEIVDERNNLIRLINRKRKIEKVFGQIKLKKALDVELAIQETREERAEKICM
ncbi:hypothetical protein KKC08_00185 [Patescibacteria group bacterium]|nr:hypothetical protein [Patescibacteria group bacterium]MCG2701692.1 hypothetical protein [Candidatus Parcubacteria bacterium]MBU4265373.1 hypothetical protein [Patescibacteria group bacterium]MBU4390325.1 hypothetical protein [Patescibacteria group bacterium]MBU4396572.1 hypothetical protein [Patescibacteria group bacterium]